jgi:hypothetical protein
MPTTSERDRQERREQVRFLMAKGLNQLDLAQTLKVRRQTIAGDIRWLNKQADSEYSKLIREGITNMFDSCVLGVSEIIKESWRIYVSKDKKWENWHKLQALRLAADCYDKRFSMLQAGPALMEINKLKSKLEAIKNGIEVGT